MPKSQPKKKPRKRRAAPGGVDPNELRRQRLEARRAQKAEALAALQRKKRRERLVRWFVYLGLAAFLFWFLFLRTLGPREIEGHRVEQFSATGVSDHRSDPQTYETVPPVSGPHNPNPAPCGIHDAQIPDENFVHTLEHGAVAVLYDPTLDAEEIAAIEEIVGDFDSHTLSAPYTGMPEPIAVVSWSRMMRLDSVDEDAIRAYIDEFRREGPEDQDCANTQESPFGVTPSPSPEASVVIPEPTATGGDSDGDKGSRRKNND